MPTAEFYFEKNQPKVVGSIASRQDLAEVSPAALQESCDLAEIRLDLLRDTDGTLPASARTCLDGIPILFTARRGDEGGAGSLSATDRSKLIEAVLDEAACVDIEVASITEMAATIEQLKQRSIPWVASCHDFDKLPDTAVLRDAAARALAAGASVFKAAAKLHSPADVARLAEFQLEDHGLPASTMGMGPLAPVSRLLCAQCGSVLNYGFLGSSPTAPGQWDAATLKAAIAKLTSIAR